MDISITTRNVELEAGIREYLREKLERLTQKYLIKINSITAAINKRKYLYSVEIRLQAKNLHVFGEGQAEDTVFPAIDSTLKKVEMQLRKHKEKVKHRKGRGLAEQKNMPDIAPVSDLDNMSFDEEDDTMDNILNRVDIEQRILKPMSVEEAALQMELVAKEHFIAFMNATTNEVNIIYRKSNGTYGVIQQAK